jgi:type II secretory pathway component PulC
VEFIGFNPRQSSAAVWFSKGDRLCQALVAAGEPALNARSLAVDLRADSRTPAEISENLEQLSDREFNLSRAAFDSLLENTLEFGRHLRFVPETVDGRVVGVRLFGLRRGTWPAALGLRNGDRIEALNGFTVSKPEALLEAYARLGTASEVTARLTRGGTPLEIAVHVK